LEEDIVFKVSCFIRLLLFYIYLFYYYLLFHKGFDVHSGHYTAITNEFEKWFFLNDSHVTSKDSYKSQAHKSDDNHMIFYKLQES
jgi:ubiquitin C-terminal hydrolase